MAARRPHSAGHRRREIARRSDAPCLYAACGGARLQNRTIRSRCRRDCGRAVKRVLPPGSRIHRRARLQRSARLVGLRFRQPEATGKAWTGAETKNDAGRLLVTRIPRGTPASDSGLNVDDEILATGDFRVRADRLDKRLESFRPGDRVSLLVALRDKLTRVDITLGEEPGKRWQLEARPDATPEQQRRMAAWLG